MVVVEVPQDYNKIHLMVDRVAQVEVVLLVVVLEVLEFMMVVQSGLQLGKVVMVVLVLVVIMVVLVEVEHPLKVLMLLVTQVRQVVLDN